MGIAVTVWCTRKLTEIYWQSVYLISFFPAAATSSQLPITLRYVNLFSAVGPLSRRPMFRHTHGLLLLLHPVLAYLSSQVIPGVR